MTARTGQDLAARKNQKVMAVQMAERGDTLSPKVGHWAEKMVGCSDQKKRHLPRPMNVSSESWRQDAASSVTEHTQETEENEKTKTKNKA